MRIHRTRSTLIPALPALVLSIVTLLFAGCSPDGSPSEEVPFVDAGGLITDSEYADRRARLMDEIPDGIAIISSQSTPTTS